MKMLSGTNYFTEILKFNVILSIQFVFSALGLKIRPDFALKMQELYYLASFILLVVLYLGLTVLIIMALRKKHINWAKMLSIFIAIPLYWVNLLLTSSLEQKMMGGIMMNLSMAAVCAGIIGAFAIIPGYVMARAFAKCCHESPRTGIALGVMTSLVMGSFFIHLKCQMNDPFHVLIGHGALVFIIGLLLWPLHTKLAVPKTA